jgi:predicted nucleic acid-binding protein
MDEADGWFMCRVGFVETIRAVTLAAGERIAGRARREWPAFGVVEVDQPLVESAATLAASYGLRSLDALHLAAALLLSFEELTLVTWDKRLHVAATRRALQVLPQTLD